MRRLLLAALAGTLLLACSPDRDRVNPLDPETKGAGQSSFRYRCPYADAFVMYFHHGLVVSGFSPDLTGKISISPPIAGANWYTSVISGGQVGYYTSDLTYGYLTNIVPGQVYTIQVTSQCTDKKGRPFLPATYTFRLPTFSGLSLSVSPASPAAGSQPTFLFGGTDFSMYQVLVTKGATYWDSGLTAGNPDQVQYPGSATPLDSGLYYLEVKLFDICGNFKNNYTTSFSVP